MTAAATTNQMMIASQSIEVKSSHTLNNTATYLIHELLI